MHKILHLCHHNDNIDTRICATLFDFDGGCGVDIEGRCGKMVWLVEDEERDDGDETIGNYLLKDLYQNVSFY